jgi:hypothetical protein
MEMFTDSFFVLGSLVFQMTKKQASILGSWL